MKIGAILGGASKEDADALYDFGVNLGLAFQLKDDLLDVYGDPLRFGKNIGGDILCNKKTYLVIKAFEHANADQEALLTDWFTREAFDPQEKIVAVTRLYNEIGVKALCENRIVEYSRRASESLSRVNVPAENRRELETMMNELMHREV